MVEMILKMLELVASALVGIAVQLLKKLFNASGAWALLLVFVLGGGAAVLGVGPTPDDTYIDTIVNAGYITGMATFLYSLIKRIKVE